ncbi:MAG: hypothetical protein WD766_07470 [Gemmatimonadota bacterium]
MPKTHKRLLIGVCLVFVVGCVGNRNHEPGELDSGTAAVLEGGIEVMVQNETTRPLRVFVREGGYDTLLGRVDPLSDESVRLQNSTAGLISLVARSSHRDIGRAHVSEPVEVLKGYRITWVLRASPGSTGPRFSTVRIFRCDDMNC